MKSFADFKKSIASVGKKKEERKPQKAMDAVQEEDVCCREESMLQKYLRLFLMN